MNDVDHTGVVAASTYQQVLTLELVFWTNVKWPHRQMAYWTSVLPGQMSTWINVSYSEHVSTQTNVTKSGVSAVHFFRTRQTKI